MLGFCRYSQLAPSGRFHDLCLLPLSRFLLLSSSSLSTGNETSSSSNGSPTSAKVSEVIGDAKGDVGVVGVDGIEGATSRESSRRCVAFHRPIIVDESPVWWIEGGCERKTEELSSSSLTLTIVVSRSLQKRDAVILAVLAATTADNAAASATLLRFLDEEMR